MKTIKFTDEAIDTIYGEWWAEAVRQYGDKYKVPQEVQAEMGEKYRALWVLQADTKHGEPSKNPFTALNHYSIMPHVAEWIVKEYCGIKEVKEVKEAMFVEKRADKWGAFLKWANQNHFHQFTTEQLTEQSGFSYQTTLKYIQVSPTFRKLKKGLWEIRDAKFDREAGI